jgi:multicomponent Na+:H+ antiporter subunit G
MMLLQEILVCALLLAGSMLMMLAGLGIQRFGGALNRAHALSKASTFGICLLLGALWISLNDEIAGLKVLLVIVFSLLTIPLAGHLIALFAFQNDQTSLPTPPRKTPLEVDSPPAARTQKP